MSAAVGEGNGGVDGRLVEMGNGDVAGRLVEMGCAGMVAVAAFCVDAPQAASSRLRIKQIPTNLICKLSGLFAIF